MRRSGGDENNWKRRTFRPRAQFPQYAETIHTRHHHVQKNQVRRELPDTEQRFGTGTADPHFKASRLQNVAYQPLQVGIILYVENSFTLLHNSFFRRQCFGPVSYSAAGFALSSYHSTSAGLYTRGASH